MIIPYVYDIYTDANLIYIYWSLWSSSPSSLVYLITGQSANDVPGSELLIPTAYLSIFLVVSMILLAFANLPKKLARYYKVQMKMKNPEVERGGEILSPSSVIHRNAVGIEESSFESPYQSIWQFGIYLSIIPLLHAVPANVVNLDELENYDKNLKFLPAFLQSSLATLWSLTRGQVQRNNIVEEYNIDWKQSILYHLASFGSTVVFLLLITSTVASWLGFNYNTSTWLTVMYLFIFTLAILSVGPVVTRFIRNIQHTTDFSASAILRALYQTLFGSTKPDSRLPAPSLSWVFSTFTAFHLPTSQHISDGCYSFYHSTITQSPQLLLQMAAQCLTYSCFLGWLLAFSTLDFDYWSVMKLNANYTINSTNIYNKSIVDMGRYDLTNRTYVLPQSDLSEAVRSSMLSTLVGIPVGFVVSYLFLFLYFYLDNGFYTNVNMDYWFQNDDEVDVDANDEDAENTDEIDRDNNDEDAEIAGGNIEVVVDLDRGSINDAQIEGDNNDEDVENAGEDSQLLANPGQDSAVGNEEDPIKVEGWLQKWIDQDVEEDFCSLRQFEACNRTPDPFKEWNMSGTWIDLTGDDGMEGDCEDGAAVLNSKDGIEFAIKMSFPFFRSEREETEVVDAGTVSTTSPTHREDGQEDELIRNRETPVDAGMVSETSSTDREDPQEGEIELGSCTINTSKREIQLDDTINMSYRESPVDAGSDSETSSTDREDPQEYKIEVAYQEEDTNPCPEIENDHAADRQVMNSEMEGATNGEFHESDSQVAEIENNHAVDRQVLNSEMDGSIKGEFRESYDEVSEIENVHAVDPRVLNSGMITREEAQVQESLREVKEKTEANTNVKGEEERKRIDETVKGAKEPSRTVQEIGKVVNEKTAARTNVKAEEEHMRTNETARAGKDQSESVEVIIKTYKDKIKASTTVKADEDPIERIEL